MSIHQRYLAMAAKLVMKHNWEDVRTRHCALIVWKKAVIAHGFNSMKTHTMAARYRKNEHAIFIHAEVQAIMRAMAYFNGDLHRLKKCTMYVVRVFRDGRFGNSRPCRGCMKAIEDHGLKAVYWSVADDIVSSSRSERL